MVDITFTFTPDAEADGYIVTSRDFPGLVTNVKDPKSDAEKSRVMNIASALHGWPENVESIVFEYVSAPDPEG